jgi:hypothetical protein
LWDIGFDAKLQFGNFLESVGHRVQ